MKMRAFLKNYSKFHHVFKEPKLFVTDQCLKTFLFSQKHSVIIKYSIMWLLTRYHLNSVYVKFCSNVCCTFPNSILSCTILMFKGKALVGLLVLRERSKDLLVLREGFTTNLLFLRGRLLSPYSVQVCIHLHNFL